MVDTGNRLLNEYTVSSASNTPQSCVAACAAKGYTIAGTEYGQVGVSSSNLKRLFFLYLHVQECWCASTFNSAVPATTVADSECVGIYYLICYWLYRLTNVH
jgi:hypothetical protein